MVARSSQILAEVYWTRAAEVHRLLTEHKACVQLWRGDYGDLGAMTIVEAAKTVLKDAEALTAEDVYDRIVAGGLYVFGAAKPKDVVKSQLRRHCIGLDFPTASPVKFFRRVEKGKYALASAEGVAVSTPAPAEPEGDETPEEAMEEASKRHLLGLRQELKEKILQNHPAFFERLVIELLIRMGYGGSDPKLGIHTGGPSDGGIDGIIKEDKLGLEQIYIQAKRYALDREVKRTEVQRFAGAMNKVKKGVFITTASFAQNAREFAVGHEKTISLIDGNLLCDLMINHGVGVSEVKSYRLLKVDGDYFATDG
jgi:restriction system protein